MSSLPLDLTILKDGRIELRLSSKIYHKDAILAVFYKFSDRATFIIEAHNDELYSILFKLNREEDINAFASAFLEELNDQQLRYGLAERTQKIKELIIRKAFFPFQGNE